MGIPSKISLGLLLNFGYSFEESSGNPSGYFSLGFLWAFLRHSPGNSDIALAFFQKIVLGISSDIPPGIHSKVPLRAFRKVRKKINLRFF